MVNAHEILNINIFKEEHELIFYLAVLQKDIVKERTWQLKELEMLYSEFPKSLLEILIKDLENSIKNSINHTIIYFFDCD